MGPPTVRRSPMCERETMAKRTCKACGAIFEHDGADARERFCPEHRPRTTKIPYLRDPNITSHGLVSTIWNWLEPNRKREE
jgi:hypothetical protein